MKFSKLNHESINNAYALAKEEYSRLGIDTDKVMQDLKQLKISLHCWQGDDVGGFEKGVGSDEKITTGGLMATGNFPGKATTPAQLRDDIEVVLSQLPGKHKVNIHTMYGESEDGKPFAREDFTKESFQNWVDWAKQNGVGIDMNSTFFADDRTAHGYSLSDTDEENRKFWVGYTKKVRELAAWIGEELDQVCVNNLWIHDGSKDTTVNRMLNRSQLKKSLDEIFSVKYDEKHTVDALESKLFGIGTESFTAGSNEFYLGYAAANQKTITFDLGHFHPTESCADKISSALLFVPNILLHISRGVRWDSDHVCILDDNVLSLMQEINRADAWDRVYVGLDYFDPSVNRVIAWITGAKAVQKAALIAKLEPTGLIREMELSGDLGGRLALLEELKTMPYGAVWNKFLMDNGCEAGPEWIDKVRKYTDKTIAERK